METYYLIDYENVRENGLDGIASLSANDHVYLFYTTNANKISLDIIANIKAEFRAVKVAAGRQSLDMHLISFLGYIIGSSSEVNNFIIVSDDHGFDSTAAFWNTNGMANIVRRKRIRNIIHNTNKNVKETVKVSVKEPEVEIAESSEVSDNETEEIKAIEENIPDNVEEDIIQESKIKQILLDNKVDAVHAQTISDIVDRNSESKTKKADIYRELLKKFGQKRGIMYYGYIKKDI